MFSPTQAQIAQAKAKAEDIGREIAAEYETSQGQEALRSDCVSWYAIAPRLCELIRRQANLEAWAQVAEECGQVRQQMPA